MALVPRSFYMTETIQMRKYEKYALEGANFRICSSQPKAIKSTIRNQRKILINYINRYPEFLKALHPLEPLPDAPEIAKRMHTASKKVGVGPMACVAGITAQFAAEAALRNGAEESIVENGGDIYLASNNEIVIGIYAQKSPLSGRIAFQVSPSLLPVAVCSSSSKMGHSLSFGNCDLASVLAPDAALADAAATQACNWVKGEDDINPTIEKIMPIEGIQGILIIMNDKIGIAGNLPELIKFDDSAFAQKITIDEKSNHTICF